MNTSATDQQLSAPRLSAPRLLTNEATIATHTHVATDRNRPRTLNTVNDRQKPTGIHTEQGHVAFWELSPGVVRQWLASVTIGIMFMPGEF